MNFFPARLRFPIYAKYCTVLCIYFVKFCSIELGTRFGLLHCKPPPSSKSTVTDLGKNSKSFESLASIKVLGDSGTGQLENIHRGPDSFHCGSFLMIFNGIFMLFGTVAIRGEKLKDGSESLLVIAVHHRNQSFFNYFYYTKYHPRKRFKLLKTCYIYSIN